MKSKAFIFLAMAFMSCGQAQKEQSVAESIVEKMEQRFNADSSSVVEADENFREQGIKRVLTVEFINCKNIDLMESALKTDVKLLAQELKSNISGSERIEKYKIVLKKDPKDMTPSKSGFNINEKGFTINREDLN